MPVVISPIPGGTITSARGFRAGAAFASIKNAAVSPNTETRPDLGLLVSDAPCSAAGVFTMNQVKAAPVLLCLQHLQAGRARALIANSGCANACTDEQGAQDALEMASLAAACLALQPSDVLVASTGVIGITLPMERLRAAVPTIRLSPEGGHDLARAIMTTDTVSKEIAVRVEVDGASFTIGGIAKGAGMIHPNMATMLAFVATDAAADAGFLREALRAVAARSFNMVSVDGDTSTNDTLVVLANGLAGNPLIHAESPLATAFVEGLTAVCAHLAKSMVRDGEGAEKLMVVQVDGARDDEEARRMARAISTSLAVKTALHGSDPNWGRIMVAVGNSGVNIDGASIDVAIGAFRVMQANRPLPFDAAAVRAYMDGNEVEFRVDLNLGTGSGMAWGCDLTEAYVTFNSIYTT